MKMLDQIEAINKALVNEVRAARAWRDLPKHLPPAKDMDTEWLLAACKEKREAYDKARAETQRVLSAYDAELEEAVEL
jgi:hypothetical protein